jgi:hypothetical protein
VPLEPPHLQGTFTLAGGSFGGCLNHSFNNFGAHLDAVHFCGPQGAPGV